MLTFTEFAHAAVQAKTAGPLSLYLNACESDKWLLKLRTLMYFGREVNFYGNGDASTKPLTKMHKDLDADGVWNWRDGAIQVLCEKHGNPYLQKAIEWATANGVNLDKWAGKP